MINEKIFEAVESANAEALEKALMEERINTTTYYGAKSIVFAAKSSNSDLLKLLLSYGAKNNRESFWSRTAYMALSNAIYSQNIENLKLLLDFGAGANVKLLKKSPILSYAIRIDNEAFGQLLKAHGFELEKSYVQRFSEHVCDTDHPDYCLEDGVYILKKSSRDGLLIQYAKQGKNKSVAKLLSVGVGNAAATEAIDAALKNNHWDVAIAISDYCRLVDFYTYSESLKKLFLRACYNEDVEKVKFYLQKLIENIVGELTDNTGRSTLEIAIENNPVDVVRILTSYGFHENSLNYAFKCLSNK